MSTECIRWAFLAIHVHSHIVIALGQRNTSRIQTNLYPFCLQNLANGLGYIFVFTSNQTRAHLNNRDFAAEAAIHLTKFQADITPADDDEVLRQKINLHHRGIVEKRDIVNARHLGDSSAPTDVDEDFLSLK